MSLLVSPLEALHLKRKASNSESALPEALHVAATLASDRNSCRADSRLISFPYCTLRIDICHVSGGGNYGPRQLGSRVGPHGKFFYSLFSSLTAQSGDAHSAYTVDRYAMVAAQSVGRSWPALKRDRPSSGSHQMVLKAESLSSDDDSSHVENLHVLSCAIRSAPLLRAPSASSLRWANVWGLVTRSSHCECPVGMDHGRAALDSGRNRESSRCRTGYSAPAWPSTSDELYKSDSRFSLLLLD